MNELVTLRHALKHDGPQGVLPRLQACVATQPANTVLATQLAYLETRVAQLQYPQFVANGWPIGSGIVESANKLVVEDRLKGAGMHWAAANVNPILALRNAIGNDRWDAQWTVIEQAQQQITERRQFRRKAPVCQQPDPRIHLPVVPAPTPTPQPLGEPDAPQPKAAHPWKRAWSRRRQRELASAA